MKLLYAMFGCLTQVLTEAVGLVRTGQRVFLLATLSFEKARSCPI